jgi:hypothetical protein
MRSRTGLRALKSRVKVRGLDVLDKRTNAARALIGWRKQLVDDLGGEGACSAQKMALVEMATRTMLFVSHLDAFLVEQESLVFGRGRKKVAIPVLLQRQQLVDSLARLLKDLGLERKEKPVPSLAEYIDAKREVEQEPAP